VRAHINQLLESQVIRESCSPYASPIVLVKKKDGSLRLCVDYRQLNAKTRRDAFPLPRIEESLDALSGARWFSTLDLASGYNQVPVSERDKSKTAFCTPFGLFEWNRMPFGLCNAPSTFQRLMERIFGDQQYQSLLLYLDDIVVFSSSVSQHLERLEVVFRRLERENLKVKLEKCAFFHPEGVATDPCKIEVVTQWPRPSTVKELRSFLGFASYYRRFVDGFAKLAAPLHRLVGELTGSKHRPGQREEVFSSAWSRECQDRFEELKSRLTTAPVLAYADFTKPFVLEVDASHGGLGAVLSQEQDGKVRPVAYASRSLRPNERNLLNYSSMKLEFLALKWAMTERFREYLLGNRCIVYTDNNPLSHLATAQLGATEQRWAAQLAAFDFDLKYRSGKIELASLQTADPVISEVLGFWKYGRYPGPEERRKLSRHGLVLLRQWKRLVERDGILYRRVMRPDGSVPEPVEGEIHQWVLEHQTRLQVAFEGARERLRAAAKKRKEQHDPLIRDAPLTVGQLVYLRDYGVRGRHKISDLRSPVVFQVVRAPEEGRLGLEAPEEFEDRAYPEGNPPPLEGSPPPLEEEDGDLLRVVRVGVGGLASTGQDHPQDHLGNIVLPFGTGVVQTEPPVHTESEIEA
ncbi:hypothetical protein F2P79_019745, partial [Pimephales promelas]